MNCSYFRQPKEKRGEKRHVIFASYAIEFFIKMLVRFFRSNENNLTKYLETNVLNYDTKNYICMKSNMKTNENKIPCQAVYNKLKIISSNPQKLKSLNKLQIVLISQRSLFKK